MPHKVQFSYIVNKHVEMSYFLLNLQTLFVLHSVRQLTACLDHENLRTAKLEVNVDEKDRKRIS